MPETAAAVHGTTDGAGDSVNAELEAMMKVSEIISSLKDEGARERVLSWAVRRFQQAPRINASAPSPSAPSPVPLVGAAALGASAREIPGIARISDTGELHLTVRDMKARSANDAALRIAHLLIYASEQLAGAGTVSSKATLVPTLRKYRAYDGNTRTVLARHRGFIREGDQISMDLHCRQEAEAFVTEILDSATEGTWKPSAKVNRRRIVRENLTEQAPS